jgi:hypothetical protein
MSRHESSRWKLSYGWLRGEDWWGDPVSQNFVLMDLLMHPWAISMNENAPPAVLAIGAQYIIGSNPVGAWANHPLELAVYTENGWVFCKPAQKGIRIGCDAPAGWYYWDGTAWVGEDKNAAAPAPASGQFYDITMWVGFAAEPLEVVGGMALPEDMTLPNGANGSLARSQSAPEFDVVISVMRNFTEQVGTITFSPGSTTAVFDVNGDQLFGKNQTISFTMPANIPEFFHNYTATIRLVLNRTGG